MDKKFTPSEYFEIIKSKKEAMTESKLDEIYQNALAVANKYQITGQVEHMKKLIFCMDTIEKQKELVKLGLTTYVSKSDVEDFIDNVSDDTVKIIELERYPREIPDEICEVIPKVKDIFNKMYVVYTDYTGRQERKVAQERRDKDPILFGVFEDGKTRTIVDEWYYIGDWVDEYCDLTLEKMISIMDSKNRPNIAKEIYTPKNLDELKLMVNSVEKNSNNDMWLNQNNLINNIHSTSNTDNKPKTFLSRVKGVVKIDNIDLTNNKVLSSNEYNGNSTFQQLRINNLFNTNFISSNFSKIERGIFFSILESVFYSCERCGKPFKYSNSIWWKYECLCASCEEELSKSLGKNRKHFREDIFKRSWDKLYISSEHENIMRKLRLSY